jgi:integrase/recombinase XerD
MAIQRAKTLTNEQLSKVLQHVTNTSRRHLRDTVIILLSFKAGLRVGEIAGLDWADMTDAFGVVRQDAFQVPSDIAKKGSEREIPMHPDLYAAVCALATVIVPTRRRGADPVIRSADNAGRVSPNTLQQYIRRIYNDLGLDSCSSHSGRRSFITAASRVANVHDCSLRDVQRLAGHRDIETTELYITASAGVGKLVAAL